MPMHALRETCTRMRLHYQIARVTCSIVGGVHVDLILCKFAKACTSRVQSAYGVLKSSSTGKDAAEHLLVIDIEAKSTSLIEMPHVGVGRLDVGNE